MLISVYVLDESRGILIDIPRTTLTTKIFIGYRFDSSHTSLHHNSIDSATVSSGKKGDFLGQANMTWADLHPLPGAVSRDLDLNLGRHEGMSSLEQPLVQGSVQLRVVKPVAKVKWYLGREDSLL